MFNFFQVTMESVFFPGGTKGRMREKSCKSPCLDKKGRKTPLKDGLTNKSEAIRNKRAGATAAVFGVNILPPRKLKRDQFNKKGPVQ